MQSQSRNIGGTFQVEIAGKKRDIKCTFGAIEKLEQEVYKRPAISVLSDAINSNIYVSDIVDTIIVGLHFNGDTRFNRNNIADEIFSKGIDEYLDVVIRYLTYAISGDKSLKVEANTSNSKKK